LRFNVFKCDFELSSSGVTQRLKIHILLPSVILFADISSVILSLFFSSTEYEDSEYRLDLGLFAGVCCELKLRA